MFGHPIFDMWGQIFHQAAEAIQNTAENGAVVAAQGSDHVRNFGERVSQQASEAIQDAIGSTRGNPHFSVGERIFQQASEIAHNNKTAVAIVGATVGGMVLGPVLMGPVLGAFGFSAIGPVAGSATAGVQSVGGVGVVFSTLQSAAMGGYGVPAVSLVFSATGGVIGCYPAVANSDDEDHSEDFKHETHGEDG